MPSHKLLGVVSRGVNYRDNDRILTIVTRDRGRITATARGSRKPQSKLLTAASAFCYGEYVLREWENRFYVSQCTVR
ncbi:recombination protein O N-terminal domain-containing protein, partial [Eubacteriales bacterium OttesenSCG-928-M02]|nr:recombination protein O N-terminal domain-containing protein [Eubacteriales bacterium OttesenSCG-928-M02]